MPSSLEDAFNFLLEKKQRQVTIERNGSTPINILMSPSNYSRNLQGPAETVIKGSEYVISKKKLVSSSFPIPPKRGDRVKDPEQGLLVVTDVEPMFVLGGILVGWRVRFG